MYKIVYFGLLAIRIELLTIWIGLLLIRIKLLGYSVRLDYLLSRFGLLAITFRIEVSFLTKRIRLQAIKIGSIIQDRVNDYLVLES